MLSPLFVSEWVSMNQSEEAHLAVLAFQVTALVAAMERVEVGQQVTAKSQEETRMEFLRFDHRLAQVEQQLAAAGPTIKEFIEVKQRVTGAGVLGKWLWSAGGAILGMVAVSREQIIKWILGQ